MAFDLVLFIKVDFLLKLESNFLVTTAWNPVAGY